MSERFKSAKYTNTSVGIGTSDAVVIGPIDVSEWDNYSLIYQNSHTANALTNLMIQVAQDASGTAADMAPNWVQFPTATLPQPSALGATAIVGTARVDNAFRWMRVVAKSGTSSTQGGLSITIGGFLKR